METKLVSASMRLTRTPDCSVRVSYPPKEPGDVNYFGIGGPLTDYPLSGKHVHSRREPLKRAQDGSTVTSITTDKRGNVYIAKSVEFVGMYAFIEDDVRDDSPSIKMHTSTIELYSQDALGVMLDRRQFTITNRQQIRNLTVATSGDVYFCLATYNGINEEPTVLCHLPPFKYLVPIDVLDNACNGRLLINCLGIVQEYLCGGVASNNTKQDISTTTMNDSWLQVPPKDQIKIVDLTMDCTRRYLYAHVSLAVPCRSTTDATTDAGLEIVYRIIFWDTMYDDDKVLNMSSENIPSKSPSANRYQRYVFGNKDQEHNLFASFIRVSTHGTCRYFQNPPFYINQRMRDHTTAEKSIELPEIPIDDGNVHSVDIVSNSDWQCFVGNTIWLWNSHTRQVRKFNHVTYQPSLGACGYACFADDGKRIFASSPCREKVMVFFVDDVKLEKRDAKCNVTFFAAKLDPVEVALSPILARLTRPVSTKVQSQCFNCNKRTATFRCARCRAAFYCNKECQSLDWSRHKLICRVAKT